MVNWNSKWFSWLRGATAGMGFAGILWIFSSNTMLNILTEFYFHFSILIFLLVWGIFGEVFFGNDTEGGVK